jgi:hypothetical protein
MTDFAIEKVPLDICPNCEVLMMNNVYCTKDIITGEKIYRCKQCFIELEYSNSGWIAKE